MKLHLKKRTTLALIACKVVMLGNVIASPASAKSLGERELQQSSMCTRYFEGYERTFRMPANLLRAIAITESGKHHKASRKLIAWPWTINVAGKGYYFKSKSEAIRAVQKYQKKGYRSIDIGCMQVNLRYHPEAFYNLHQAFEPKYNVGYAAKFLRSHYENTGSWKRSIGNYHNMKPRIHHKYVKRVLNTWRREDKEFTIAMLNTRRAIPKISDKFDSRPNVTEITNSVMDSLDSINLK